MNNICFEIVLTLQIHSEEIEPLLTRRTSVVVEIPKQNQNSYVFSSAQSSVNEPSHVEVKGDERFMKFY
jgi:hypothetical protein